MEVIGSNVLLFAFSRTPFREDAKRVLRDSRAIVVPDVFLGECANVLARLVRLRQMSGDGARDVLDAIRSLVGLTVATGPLVRRAFDRALALNHGVFDCLYLEVARDHGARFVTADTRFLQKLRGQRDEDLVVHLSDWRPEDSAP